MQGDQQLDQILKDFPEKKNEKDITTYIKDKHFVISSISLKLFQFQKQFMIVTFSIKTSSS